MAYKLMIRESGFIRCSALWYNFLKYVKDQNPLYDTFSLDDKVNTLEIILAKQKIRLCTKGSDRAIVWLEFNTEADKHWFLIKYGS